MTEAAAQSTNPQAPVIEVSRSDLPLGCPLPGQALWSLHPRVFLPIEKTGEAVCPYCGAQYRLKK